MNTDPIADFLTRIRNAALVSKDKVEMPANKLKVELAKLLQREGYLKRVELLEDREKTGQPYSVLRLTLKYDGAGYPIIRQIKRESRPGLRKYFRVNNIPRVLSGAGIAVISTSQGLKTDRQARKENIGGELLCTVQ